MTREEAIDKLKWLWNEIYNEDSDGSDYAEAIDMAIESLSEPQMVETIRITMSNGDIYYHDFGAERREP